jgi:hypothetical protein
VWNIGSIKKGAAMQTVTGFEQDAVQTGGHWRDAAEACLFPEKELPQLAEKVTIHRTVSAKFQFISHDGNWDMDAESVHRRFTAAMWLGIRISSDMQKNVAIHCFPALPEMRKELQSLLVRLIRFLPERARTAAPACKRLTKN